MPDNEKRYLSVFMDQNNKCNLRCIMCGFSDIRVKSIPKYDMPLWLFEKIAKEIFPKANYLALSCLTEPLMTIDFYKRLDYLKVCPVPFTEIVTNGVLLDEKIITKMIEVGISRLAISIDSHDPLIYESIRIGSKLEKVIKNIKIFNGLKKLLGSKLPALRINHVLMEMNIDKFSQFLKFVESLEAQCIDVRTIIPIEHSGYRWQERKLFFDKVVKAREELHQWTQETGIEDIGYLRWQYEEIILKDNSGEKIICKKPWDSIAIHANGDLMPCISWARGKVANIADRSFEDIWNSQELNRIRDEFEKERPGIDCMHCKIRVKEDGEDDYFYNMLNKLPPRKE